MSKTFKTFSLIIIILFTSGLLAARDTIEMEILFEKELKPHLKLLQTREGGRVYIQLINSIQKDSLLLDTFVYYTRRLSSDPITQIFDVYLKDNELYIFQISEMKILFERFIFKPDKHFKKEVFVLFELPHYFENSIRPYIKHRDILEFDNRLYFYAEVTGGNDTRWQPLLCCYSLLSNKLFRYSHELRLRRSEPKISGSEVNFDTLNYDTEEGKRIVEEGINGVLRREGRLDADKEIDLLFYLDTNKPHLYGLPSRGGRSSYFFYRDTIWSKVKMIRYWHDDEDSAWEIDIPIEEIPISERIDQ